MLTVPNSVSSPPPFTAATYATLGTTIPIDAAQPMAPARPSPLDPRPSNLHFSHLDVWELGAICDLCRLKLWRQPVQHVDQRAEDAVDWPARQL
eukprot:363886-Chlamydomonas_euryale.AAC.7